MYKKNPLFLIYLYDHPSCPMIPTPYNFALGSCYVLLASFDLIVVMGVLSVRQVSQLYLVHTTCVGS